MKTFNWREYRKGLAVVVGVIVAALEQNFADNPYAQVVVYAAMVFGVVGFKNEPKMSVDEPF